ncbi:MAG TPA: molybdopterin-dependent oxidoreductase [Candidatus Nanopelagicaceae bacterium]|nr:molybdopterin-dependent oxidoreductase [Candidatus Nanopelagicaceae bacterium]
MRAGGHRGLGEVIGLIAVIAGLAIAQLVAALRNGLNNPIVSLGNRIIDHVPAAVKKFAIKTFGVNDKTALVFSILVVVLILAMLIGRISASGNQRLAYGLVTTLIAIAGAAALFDAGASLLSLLPSLAAGATAILILHWFSLKRAGVSHDQDGLSRRELFKAFTLIGVGTVAAAGVSKFLGDRASVQLQRLNIALPRPLKFLPPPPADPAATVPGLSTLFTPNSHFYRIDTALTVPNISIDTWRLRIDGMVKKPREFTYSELSQRPVFELDDTISCVSNEVGGYLVGNARWLGIRLDDLIKEVGPSAKADQIMGYSSDGFSAGFPLAALDGRDAMIAFGMNGEPLPLNHGYPARIIVPGLYGYVSATKWLTRIELTRFDLKQGYWVPRGWSALAPIKTQSRIDTPRSGTSVKAGNVAIAGVAWAPTRGISRVEVRVGNGQSAQWREATLGPELAKTTWRQWWINWEAKPGATEISVRATDGTGALQSSTITPPDPNGAQGWHTISVNVS